MTVDVVVVGGGHNGLVCAAYLAKAGLDVTVVERGERPGGALLWTDWNGFRLERGALEHTSILTTGVLEELDLAAHGLTYWCRTTNGTHMFGDGTRIIIEETAEATAASIEQLSPADAAAWVELGERSQPVLKAFGLASEGWVPPPAVANGFARLVAGRRGRPTDRTDAAVRGRAGDAMVREPVRAGDGDVPLPCSPGWRRGRLAPPGRSC